jgi:endonuclease III
MRKENIGPFFAILQAANPLPETELEYTSAFELLTAVLLSAQATDVGVNKATRRLFPVANTPQAILELGLERLEDYIKTIGLYRTKARNLMETCRILVEQYGGEVPRTREALESLPGVGRKTANVVLGHALGVPGLPVDRHVLRVANRIGLVKNDDPIKVEAQLCEMLPPKRWTRASDDLILHGRRICKPKPLCPRCNVRQDCDFYRTGVVTKPIKSSTLVSPSTRKPPSEQKAPSPRARKARRP